MVVGSLITAHPEESECLITPGCNFGYWTQHETIERVTRYRSGEVSVEVTYINSSDQPQAIDPADYFVSADVQHRDKQLPTNDAGCPIPRAQEVPAHSRLTQKVCFRLADPKSTFDLHVPWTGWDTDIPTYDEAR